MTTWDVGTGVVELPSGRRVRGRSWHESVSEYADVCAVLTTASPEEFEQRNAVAMPQELIYIMWPDNRVPQRPQHAFDQLAQLLERASEERVEITCGGGVGRTGSALAIFAMIDGMSVEDAIDFVRDRYNKESVSGHAQRGFLMEIASIFTEK